MGKGDQGGGVDAEDAAMVCGSEVWSLHQRSIVKRERNRYAREMGEWRRGGRQSQGCAATGGMADRWMEYSASGRGGLAAARGPGKGRPGVGTHRAAVAIQTGYLGDVDGNPAG